ncbi:MAG TPA: hypothetical protein VLA56_15440 [Pseudomonadales bacterium]|nr:hypothetical protein [Pseudomonadales bacterium]
MFLLRKHFVALLTPVAGSSADDGQQFIDSYERINYDQSINGRLSISALGGDDAFYVDDNSAITTLDGGLGDDRFQIGQVFGTNLNGTPDDPTTRTVRDDVDGIDLTSDSDDIELLQITRGFLSNGVTLPTTIFGGEGQDTFTVYSNKAVLRMEGEQGNDNFVIRAFIAEDDLIANGGGDDDSFEYNINAPLSINGGEGFDTVVVIGTERSDNFIITEDGVFGAGLTVRVDGVEESIEVDGLEGDDQFFILSTRDNVITTVIGGLGSDTFNVAGDVTADVVSQSLDGRAAIINHGALSGDPDFDKQLVDGIALTIADGQQGTVVITQSGGSTELIEDSGQTDFYDLAFALPSADADATTQVYVTISAAMSSSADRRRPVRDGGAPAESVLISVDGGATWVQAATLTFDAADLNAGINQRVLVKAASDAAIEGERKVMISHSVDVTSDSAFDLARFQPEAVPIENVEVRVFDDDLGTALILETDGETRVLEGTPFTDADGLLVDPAIEDGYRLRLAVPPAAGTTVTVTLEHDADIELFDADGNRITSVTFDASNAATGQLITVRAVDDLVRENRESSRITHRFSSDDPVYAEAASVDLDVRVEDDDTPRVLVTESDGGTRVITGGAGDDYRLRLTQAPAAGETVTVQLFGDGQTAYVDDARIVDSPIGGPQTLTLDLQDNAIVDGATIGVSTDGENVITHADGGDWIADGVAVGDVLRLVSASDPADAWFVDVIAVTAGELTVGGGRGITSPTLIDVEKQDALVRKDGGSWLDDGYRVGTLIDIDQDGSTLRVKVNSVTDDSLILTGSAQLTAAEDVTVTLQRIAPSVVFSADDWYETVEVQIEADPSFRVDPDSRYLRQEPQREHVISAIQGPLVIEGNVAEGKDRSLKLAVTLPHEAAGAPLPLDLEIDETQQADRLNVWNDGSRADEQGLLSSVELRNEVIKLGDPDNGISPVNLSGFGMSDGLTVDISIAQDGSEEISFPAGITFDDIEVTEILLGQGNDRLDIAATSQGTFGAGDKVVTVVHGGGNTPLVSSGAVSVVGDTVVRADSASWADLGYQAGQFVQVSGSTAGNDGLYEIAALDGAGLQLVDAALVAETGPLEFAVTGDAIVVTGGGGVDSPLVIFGDTSQDGSRYDSLPVLGEQTGNALFFATHGNDVIDASASAGSVTVYGGRGDDVIIGSQAGDHLAGGSGDDLIRGQGGADNLYGDGGFNLDFEVVGEPDAAHFVARLLTQVDRNTSVVLTADHLAAGSDELHGDAGDDRIIGDHGVIDQVAGTLRLIETQQVERVRTTEPTNGAADRIFGGLGADLILGGLGGDEISGAIDGTRNAADGSNVILGDLGSVDFVVADGDDLADIDLVESTETQLGGDDRIVVGDGNDLVLGGAGSDTIDGGRGANLVFGDSGRIASAELAGGFVAADVPQLGRLLSLGTLETVSPTLGGADTIVTGTGVDIILGGAAGDVITANDGEGVNGAIDSANLILGDHGRIEYVSTDGVDPTDIDVLESTDIELGGMDLITTGSANDIILGGTLADLIHGGDGANLILGDSGRIRSADTVNGTPGSNPVLATWAVTLGEVTTLRADNAGDDVILTGLGADTVLGGLGADRIETSVGAAADAGNLVFGDLGRIDWVSTDRTDPTDIDVLESILPEQGGDDSILTGSGNDIIVAGFGNDTVTAGGDASDSGRGANIVFGDSGRISSVQTVSADGVADPANPLDGHPIALGLIESTALTLGGDDVITTGVGRDIVLGGVGNDRLTLNSGEVAGNDGNNLAFGDNGMIAYVNLGDGEFGDTDTTDIDRIWSLDVPDTMLADGTMAYDGSDGGDDLIVTGDANDIVVGGDGNDAIITGNGLNIVVGDGAELTSAEVGIGSLFSVHTFVLGAIETICGAGGDEVILGGDGQDVLFGGAGSDRIEAGAGADFILGDDGIVYFDLGGDGIEDVDLVESFLSYSDDDDTIDGGEGADIIMGGSGEDTIRGQAGNDLIFGDHGRVTATAGGTIDPNLLPLSGTPAFTFEALHTGNVAESDCYGLVFPGADDYIEGNDGDDILIGQQGADVIYGNAGDDDLIGGHASNILDPTATAVSGGWDGSDFLDGNLGNDVLIGDNALIDRTGTTVGPRMQVLSSTVIYGETLGVDDGEALVTGVAQADPDGNETRVIVLLDHDDALEAASAPSHGDDYLAGGGDDDLLFGQLGDDVLLGDADVAAVSLAPATGLLSISGSTGSVSFDPATAVVGDTLFIDDHGFASGDVVSLDGDLGAALAGQTYQVLVVDDHSLRLLAPVAAERDAAGLLQITASVERDSDGDDYIEGNGGADLIFGNLGQDDLVGGSSSMFGLAGAETLRPDGRDLIFGGAGTDLARNDAGDLSAEGHARDADVIAGDNANIQRLVGVDGVDSGAYLRFEYDRPEFGYSANEFLVPRAVTLLDYIEGGPDLDAAALGDNGASDEIHGESGDDMVYGQTGDDVLYGEGQNDDLIGGWGRDWISGGTGIDGVLGDDGRIYTSRNSATHGESLYDIAAVDEVDKYIATPGKHQESIINVAGALTKSVNLTPFDVDAAGEPLFDARYADDIIYGGLGDDFLHGGAGDDAISGAEALALSAVRIHPDDGTTDATRTDSVVLIVGYDVPVVLSDLEAELAATDPAWEAGVEVLGFEALVAEEFAHYDENLPRQKILVDGVEFFMNFALDEGPQVELSPDGLPIYSDGDDVIFGDLGNDWLVGGTGRDSLYGGRGNDLHNLDDDQDTNGGVNDAPDGPQSSYEDLAFGGAGRDVLIGNTGGDRLIDWVGEFNSFVVPYAPFGASSISRTLQPQLAEFLYERSYSQGADATRSSDTAGDLDRNGEPNGELGMVRQQDPAWGDQTGGPDDPQAGNLGGVQRDVLRTATTSPGGSGDTSNGVSGTSSTDTTTAATTDVTDATGGTSEVNTTLAIAEATPVDDTFGTAAPAPTASFDPLATDDPIILTTVLVTPELTPVIDESDPDLFVDTELSATDPLAGAEATDTLIYDDLSGEFTAPVAPAGDAPAPVSADTVDDAWVVETGETVDVEALVAAQAVPGNGNGSSKGRAGTIDWTPPGKRK